MSLLQVPQCLGRQIFEPTLIDVLLEASIPEAGIELNEPGSKSREFFGARVDVRPI